MSGSHCSFRTRPRRFGLVDLTLNTSRFDSPFAVMSVIFCEHTQCLIQRRFSTCFFTVRLSKEIMLEFGVTVVVDVGVMS